MPGQPVPGASGPPSATPAAATMPPQPVVTAPAAGAAAPLVLNADKADFLLPLSLVAAVLSLLFAAIIFGMIRGNMKNTSLIKQEVTTLNSSVNAPDMQEVRTNLQSTAEKLTIFKKAQQSRPYLGRLVQAVALRLPKNAVLQTISTDNQSNVNLKIETSTLSDIAFTHEALRSYYELNLHAIKPGQPLSSDQATALSQAFFLSGLTDTQVIPAPNCQYIVRFTRPVDFDEPAFFTDTRLTENLKTLNLSLDAGHFQPVFQKFTVTSVSPPLNSTSLTSKPPRGNLSISFTPSPSLIVAQPAPGQPLCENTSTSPGQGGA